MKKGNHKTNQPGTKAFNEIAKEAKIIMQKKLKGLIYTEEITPVCHRFYISLNVVNILSISLFDNLGCGILRYMLFDSEEPRTDNRFITILHFSGYLSDIKELEKHLDELHLTNEYFQPKEIKQF
jgi:hypothetical protein